MYELIVLSLLMHWPMHGYVLVCTSNEIIGPWEQVSKGTMYSLLGKMERAGMIQAADPSDVQHSSSDRQSKAYEITPDGRARFFELMLDTASGLNNYRRQFHVKAMHLNLLELDDRLYLVDHYITYCQTAMRHDKKKTQEFNASTERRARFGAFFFESVLDYWQSMTETWQVELTWAQRLRERVETFKQAPEGPEERQQMS